MTKFFYYSVAKLPTDMVRSELLDEIKAALSHEANCRNTGQGVGEKESFRRTDCELELAKKPDGIADWTNLMVNDDPE